MKTIRSCIHFMLIQTLILVGLNSCEESNDSQKPYYGTWESAIYPIRNLSNGDIISWEKMIFQFTNTTFKDDIYQGLFQANTTLAIQMAGKIDNNSDKVLQTEINLITYQGATVKKESDSILFESMFALTLGARLNENFEASYEVSGDTLIFTIPVKIPSGGTVNQSLKLLKP